MRQFYKILLICLPFFMVVSCVTQRKKDEVKGLKLFFHNLNSKYNGFFNATVLMDDAVEKLNFQHQDNYNQILDVYPEIAVENATAVSPDLDKAIEKVAVVATFHRPGHWTDDSYLLLGKAQHYKHDFQAAQESFEYLVDVYDPALKKKMSSKERQKAAEEARKEKAEARADAQKAKKAERDEQEKERKKAVEDAKKEKEDKAKKEQEDAAKRVEEKKKEIEEAAKDRKAKSEGEKKTITDRNEARRKANEERRIANEEARKQAARDAKNKNLPKTDDKKETTRVATDATQPKEKKAEMKKTGSNATPVFVVEETNKVSRVKGKPKSYFLKHRPCHQEGMVWLARTYTERQNYSDAELILDNLEKSPKTFKDIRRMAAVAKAHLFLKEKNYEQAIPALEHALKINKKKKIKARLAYILAQLYQMNNNNEKAFVAFDKVLDYGPAYEMEFNSRLNMALTTSTSSENTTALLLKMAKNFKNREYGDQIYFTLAQIALKNNDKVKAVDYLQQSLATTGRNKQQKIEAYYMMAKLQYESENYVDAKAYYDSTLTVMSKDDNRKAEVERYATNLVEIARNISIITLQDSLLKLASMTDKERKEVATQIRKAKADKAAALKAPSVAGSASGLDPSLQIGASKSNYWAYNTDLVKKGKKEFEKKWGGDRKLEDNWNRSNKKGSNGDFVQNADVISGQMSDKEAKEILKDVPKTPAEIDDSKGKVNEALFQLGTLYHDKLQNEKKTVETLEKHLDRFPANKHEMEDFYYLYLAHTDMKNTAKAQDYFNRLQEKYPTSQYAQILKDPNALKSKAESVDKFYDDTYKYFKGGDYKKASERIAISESNYGVNNPLKPKFALLNAMCIGSLQGREAYVNALKDVVAKFNETPEQKNAKEMLRILENGITVVQPVADSPTQGENSGGFKVENEKLHYVVIILAKDAIVEDAKIAVSDFNTKFHRTEDLKLTSIFINTDPEIPSIIIRRFKDKATALVYTDGIAKNAGEFIKGAKYDVYAVSQDNYRELLRQKTLDAYKIFYDKNYKK